MNQDQKVVSIDNRYSEEFQTTTTIKTPTKEKTKTKQPKIPKGHTQS